MVWKYNSYCNSLTAHSVLDHREKFWASKRRLDRSTTLCTIPTNRSSRNCMNVWPDQVETVAGSRPLQPGSSPTWPPGTWWRDGIVEHELPYYALSVGSKPLGRFWTLENAMVSLLKQSICLFCFAVQIVNDSCFPHTVYSLNISTLLASLVIAIAIWNFMRSTIALGYKARKNKSKQKKNAPTNPPA